MAQIPDKREFDENQTAYDHPDTIDEVVTGLRAKVKGQIILPKDKRYDGARTLFYGGFDIRPAAIIRVKDEQDTAHVIAAARDSGMELAVRSGGHSFLGHSLAEGGLVIDLRNLTSLQIDPVSRTAWAGSGLTAGEFTTAADAHHLVAGFGDTATVGIGGLTLGGGVGYLVRKHGLTIDNLLAAKMVTADGRIIQVDQDHHPDLFWAIRGGGGNFGVVTGFRYQLHPLDMAYGGMLILPATPQVISEFIALAEEAPDELSTIANVMGAPPMPFLAPEMHGKLILFALMMYAGDPESGQRAVEPYRKLAKPYADMLHPMRYKEIFQGEESEGEYHPTAVSHTMFMNKVDRDTAGMILEYLNISDSPMKVAQLRALGGAAARVPEDATAYSHRRSHIMANLVSFFETEDERGIRQDWVNRFASAVQQEDTGAYVNFLSRSEDDHKRAAYPGSTWEKLRRIKARYDPDNLFHRNLNIPPASDL